MNDNVIVIGAGVSGLSLARQLSASGACAVRLIEKSQGVGGRCASRRVDGLPVDHGVAVLHGASDTFQRELKSIVDCTLIDGWPWRVVGPGTPCQPQAFRTQSSRAAVVQGVNALPKHLAAGLNIARGTMVHTIRLDGGRFVVSTDKGGESAGTLVITCPVDQTRKLLEPLAATSPQVRAVLQVLQSVFMMPSLTVLAGYDRPPDPDWHIMLPGPDSALHSVINDSSKRDARSQVIVCQASARYSRAHLEADPARWSAELLADASALLGDWVQHPRWQQHHRWRYARVQRGHELSHPVLIDLPGGARLALCGEAFNPRGGVEGAFLSGIELAQRLGSDPS